MLQYGVLAGVLATPAFKVVSVTGSFLSLSLHRGYKRQSLLFLQLGCS